MISRLRDNIKDTESDVTAESRRQDIIRKKGS